MHDSDWNVYTRGKNLIRWPCKFCRNMQVSTYLIDDIVGKHTTTWCVAYMCMHSLAFFCASCWKKHANRWSITYIPNCWSQAYVLVIWESILGFCAATSYSLSGLFLSQSFTRTRPNRSLTFVPLHVCNLQALGMWACVHVCVCGLKNPFLPQRESHNSCIRITRDANMRWRSS